MKDHRRHIGDGDPFLCGIAPSRIVLQIPPQIGGKLGFQIDQALGNIL